MASAWNMFVKKIYLEGKKKNKNYQFKDALKEGSRRKGEMGSMKKSSKKSMKMKGGSSCMKMKGGKRSRKRTRKMRGGTGNSPGAMFGSDSLQFKAGNAGP